MKSSTTALLWGDRWWIEGRTEPIVFGDLHRAAEVLVEHFGSDNRPASLRLIYQPTSLVAVSVDCPKGNRETLRLALSEQFPALESADIAWSFEPIVGGRDQFATVLYHETQSGLFALVQALQHAGIELEGAWPLPTLLNLVPEDWPDSGALTVVAVVESQTLVFRHTPDGKREVQSALGAEAETLALTAVRAALARTDIALYLVSLDQSGERLAAQLPSLDVPRLRLISWSGLVAAAATLARGQPSQLIPIAPLMSARRTMLAASALVCVAALGLAGDYLHAEFVRRSTEAAHANEIATLRAEIAQRRAAQTEQAALRAAVQAGESGAALFASWLRSLGTKLPRVLVLTTLRTDREGFVLSGGLTTAMTESAWRDWLAAIAPADGRWKLAESYALPSADFKLVGHIRP